LTLASNAVQPGNPSTRDNRHRKCHSDVATPAAPCSLKMKDAATRQAAVGTHVDVQGEVELDTLERNFPTVTQPSAVSESWGLLTHSSSSLCGARTEAAFLGSDDESASPSDLHMAPACILDVGTSEVGAACSASDTANPKQEHTLSDIECPVTKLRLRVHEQDRATSASVHTEFDASSAKCQAIVAVEAAGISAVPRIGSPEPWQKSNATRCREARLCQSAGEISKPLHSGHWERIHGNVSRATSTSVQCPVDVSLRSWSPTAGVCLHFCSCHYCAAVRRSLHLRRDRCKAEQGYTSPGSPRVVPTSSILTRSLLAGASTVPVAQSFFSSPLISPRATLSPRAISWFATASITSSQVVSTADNARPVDLASERASSEPRRRLSPRFRPAHITPQLWAQQPEGGVPTSASLGSEFPTLLVDSAFSARSVKIQQSSGACAALPPAQVAGGHAASCGP